MEADQVSNSKEKSYLLLELLLKVRSFSHIKNNKPQRTQLVRMPPPPRPTQRFFSAKGTKSTTSSPRVSSPA